MSRDAPSLMISVAAGAADSGFPGWALVSGFYQIQATANAAIWSVPLPLQVGDVIDKATFRVKPNGATNEVACALYVRKDGANVVVGTTGTSSSGVAWEDVVINDPLSAHVLAEGEVVFAVFSSTGGGAGAKQAQSVEIARDRGGWPRP